MKKRGKFVFLKLVSIFIVATIWIGLIFYEQLPQILKPEVAEKVLNFYQNYPGILRVLYFVRVILISLIPLTILLIILRIFVFQNKKELEGIDLKEVKLKTKTDLDALYAIIQVKKELKISSIAQLFQVEKDLAMEWGKILEAGDLAVIEYPGFGGPILKVAEEETEEEEEIEDKKDKKKSKKEIEAKAEVKSKDKKVEKKSKKILRKNLKKVKKELKKLDNKKKKIDSQKEKAIKKIARKKKSEIKGIKKEIKKSEKKR